MRHHQLRTTPRRDDDVLASARVMVRQPGVSFGAVISELARRGLRQPLPLSAERASRRIDMLLPLQPEGSPVDLELVKGLRDELP